MSADSLGKAICGGGERDRPHRIDVGKFLAFPRTEERANRTTTLLISIPFNPIEGRTTHVRVARLFTSSCPYTAMSVSQIKRLRPPPFLSHHPQSNAHPSCLSILSSHGRRCHRSSLLFFSLSCLLIVFQRSESPSSCPVVFTYKITCTTIPIGTFS